ncbi:MAG: Hsp20/alpha crystallin family protein [Cetobacterium sp.]|uniref:Hsp20/alpha crystallin family protein n=1 Tax=unclassified Cetobacterium TaxID=2630983 RepID=UPI00163D2A20|nr:Hsp20/alpha crystallin family protein [Cetobacterium sp. 2A]MBC2855142.1 Hsp20/alpha crystallin family protein [Cetobacterium sp. 2A]
MQLTKKNDNFLNFFSDFFDDKRALEPFKKNVIPSVNLLENDNEYEIDVCAPGIPKDDIKIAITGDSLTISYDYEENKEENKKDFTKKEFVYRSFKRTTTIPSDVLRDQITANFENGILALKLPKDHSKKEETKNIEIK